MGAYTASVTARELLAEPVDADEGLILDPLRFDGSLVEAELVESLVHGLEQRAVFTFDLRVALDRHPGNAGVLVANRLSRVEWTVAANVRPRYAWVIHESRAESDGSALSLALRTQAGDLVLSCGEARFYVCDGLALRESPPDYVQDDPESIRQNSVTLDELLEVRAGSRWPS